MMVASVLAFHLDNGSRLPLPVISVQCEVLSRVS